MADGKFTKVQDLVNYALRGSWAAEKRFELRVDTRWEWADAAEGSAFYAAMEEYDTRYEKEVKDLPWGGEEQQAIRAKYNDLRKTVKQPAKNIIKTYQLLGSRSDSRWSRDEYSLSVELGKQLESIWTRKENRWNHNIEVTGYLTIKGMLKRLGKTDIASQIKEEEARQARITEVRRHNYDVEELLKVWVTAQKLAKNMGIDELNQAAIDGLEMWKV